METFKGWKYATGGGESPSRCCISIVACQVFKKGEIIFQWKDLSQDEAREK
jgi:hypothetical protein